MTLDQWTQAVGSAAPMGLVIGLVVAWMNSWRV